MSWIDEYWSQDDDKNSGFPFITDAGLSSQADLSEVKTIWAFSDETNFGLPFISNTGLALQADLSEVKTIWAFSDETNFGFPYIKEAPVITNPLTIMIGSIPAKRIYMGSELIWVKDGINKIIITQAQ